MTGGGAVYQGGLGSGKTLTGATWIAWAHQMWPGLQSLIGRESYPAHLTSTAQEFFGVIERMPGTMIRAASKPTKNAMGWVEWALGGKTLLCSLSDSTNWASANLGAAWVDEGHLQHPDMVTRLQERLRQVEGPRAMLVTTNPMGKGWIYKLAHPKSKTRKPNWRWVQAPTDENPTLTDDYIARLYSMYPPGTPAHKRWVKGESAALEGTVFTEYDPNPAAFMHVVPEFKLPLEWPRVRALDFGISHPMAVGWFAFNGHDYFCYDLIYRAHLPISEAAMLIRQKDGDAHIVRTPADPQIWASKRLDSRTGAETSIADEWLAEGIAWTPANNDRTAGLQKMLDVIRIDPERCHYLTGDMGAPRLYFFDKPELEEGLDELSRIRWPKISNPLDRDTPEDVQKKDDHFYDMTRYAMMEPLKLEHDEPERRPRRTRPHSKRRYRGY